MVNERTSRTRMAREKANEPPDAQSEKFAFLVATYAWQEGLTANKIAREIFQDSSPLHLMQVKRALGRAHGTMLKLKPPVVPDLETRLDKVVNADIKDKMRFYVVDDRYVGSGIPVYVKAAEVVGGYILEFGNKEKTYIPGKQKPAEDSVLICNAGGRTVAETVKALSRNPPILKDSANDLLFVAANTAYRPTEFQLSANFLSVTMAEVFNSAHLALPMQEDKKLADDHKELVARTSLFVCSAGSCHAGDESGLMSKYLKDYGCKVPKNAVGDIAFNLLDENGHVVKLAEKPMRFMRKINPSVDIETFREIVRMGNRVLLILGSDDPGTKKSIGLAVLRQRYATDVVLGARLAKLLLEELGVTE